MTPLAADEPKPSFAPGDYHFITTYKADKPADLSPAVYDAKIVEEGSKKRLIVNYADSKSVSFSLLQKGTTVMGSHSSIVDNDSSLAGIWFTMISAKQSASCIYGEIKSFKQGELKSEETVILLPK